MYLHYNIINIIMETEMNMVDVFLGSCSGGNSFFLDNKSEKREIIMENSEFLKNDIKISKIVREIPYYYNYFSPILDNINIEFGEIDEENKKYLHFDKLYNQRKMVIIKKMDEKYETVEYFLSNIKNQNQFFNEFINIYKKMLKSLEVLEENDICYIFMGDNRDDIDISIDKYGAPILEYFGFSLVKSSLDVDLLKNININHDFLPIDFCIINFLLNNPEIESISSQNLLKICEKYVLGNKTFIEFQKITGKKVDFVFYKKNIEYFMKYVNQRREKIIAEVYEKGVKTWANYQLSILFLNLLMRFVKYNGDSRIFYDYFSQMLLTNIQPSIEKRLDINKNISYFDEFIEMDEKQWKNFSRQIKI